MDALDLFQLWFPGRGEERRRPQTVPGTWKASKDYDGVRHVVSARFRFPKKVVYFEGKGKTSDEALYDLLVQLETDFQFLMDPDALNGLQNGDGLPSTVPLPFR